MLIFFSNYLCRIEESEETDRPLAPIVNAMKEKFLKYWEHVPLITIVANVLHPTYKLHYTVKMLRKYKSYLGLAVGDEEPTIRQVLQQLVSAYITRSNVQQPASSSQTRRFKFL